MECVKCEKCGNYFHTSGVTRTHTCKLFPIKWRQVVSDAFTKPVFTGDWSKTEVWAIDRREALDKVLSDRFFRDNNSTFHRDVFVEMKLKTQTYVGHARMRFDGKIKLQK